MENLSGFEFSNLRLRFIRPSEGMGRLSQNVACPVWKAAFFQFRSAGFDRLTGSGSGACKPARHGAGKGMAPSFQSQTIARTLSCLTLGLSVLFLPFSGRAQSGLIRGEVFLKQNAKQEGVKTLPSGLQIKVLAEGRGRQPKSSDTVVVHYRGKLISGTEFDSSHKRGEPATFRLNQVIKGWTEGIQLLREGGKAELYIPSELAYGQKGAGANIGPDEVLVFEVELIAVK